MVQQMFFATKSTDCRWRRCQVNPCFLWVYGLFRTAGFLNVFAFWCAGGKGLFSGRAFQGGEHELPVFLNARDVAAFVGRVWRAERWAEAHHVHRMPGADDAAFQSCVNDLHLVVRSEEFLVDALHQFNDFAVWVGLPGGVVTAQFHLHAGH